MVERRGTLTAAQISLLNSPKARGMGLDRLGRMATMPAFDELSKQETWNGVTVVEIGGGLPLHNVAMEQYWLHMCRGTALSVVKEFDHILRSDHPFAGMDGRLSNYFSPRERDKIIENFDNPEKGAHQMLVAAITELLSNPPQLPRNSNKRRRALQEDLYMRLNTAQAYRHDLVVDIPVDEYGLGRNLIVVPKVFKDKMFRDIVHEMLGSDQELTHGMLDLLSRHFSAVLFPPHILKPFRIINMDTRDPQQLIETADRLYPEWFKDTITYKSAREFRGFIRQDKAWDLSGLEEEQANQIIMKQPLPTNINGDFQQFRERAPLAIARDGLIAFVPASVLYEGEKLKLQFGEASVNAENTGVANQWIQEHGFEIRVRGCETDHIRVAGVNSYEREIFKSGPYSTPRPDGKIPKRLYVVTFKKPRRSLAEHVDSLETPTPLSLVENI